MWTESLSVVDNSRLGYILFIHGDDCGTTVNTGRQSTKGAGHSPSGSKVLKIGEIREVGPPRLEDLTRPVCRRPLRVLGWFAMAQVVLERFGILRRGSAEMGLTSVGVISASNSESSESLRGANSPQSGETVSSWVRDWWRGRRATGCKVRTGRVVLVWEGRRLVGLAMASGLRPSI